MLRHRRRFNAQLAGRLTNAAKASPASPPGSSANAGDIGDRRNTTQVSNQAALGREIHLSINPALADFDRALRRAHDDGPSNLPDTDGRALFLARARAVVARTRLLWD